MGQEFVGVRSIPFTHRTINISVPCLQICGESEFMTRTHWCSLRNGAKREPRVALPDLSHSAIDTKAQLYYHCDSFNSTYYWTSQTPTLERG